MTLICEGEQRKKVICKGLGFSGNVQASCSKLKGKRTLLTNKNVLMDYSYLCIKADIVGPANQHGLLRAYATLSWSQLSEVYALRGENNGYCYSVRAVPHLLVH
jgi:hypothetical protein